MRANVVLDTNVVSALMVGLPKAIAAVADMSPTRLVLTAPVAAEIEFGLHRLVPESARRRLLRTRYERLKGDLQWSDWTADAAQNFGRHKATLSAAGRIVEDMDIAIASCATAAGMRLATANIRHFDRIEGLELWDWRQLLAK